MLAVVDWHYVPALLFVLVVLAASFWHTHKRTRRSHAEWPNEFEISHDRQWLLANLSPRETEIARLVAQGRRNQDIARELSIAEHTVETHLTHIYRKLEISNRVELTRAVSDLLERL